jgi:hypothetical protein
MNLLRRFLTADSMLPPGALRRKPLVRYGASC